jgi:RHS repeat-associated protein
MAGGRVLDLVNPASGLCLTDPSSSTTNGTQLQVQTCGTAAGQQWRLPEDQTGYVTNGVTAKCMDDTSDSSSAGTKVQIYGCLGDGSQTWTVNGWALTVNGQCLEPSGAGTAAGTGLVIEPCTAGTTAQDWAAGPDGWLWNASAAKCADDPSGSTTNGTQLAIEACTSPLSTDQTWRPPQRLAPAGPFTSGVAGKCLDDTGGSAAAGTTVQVWACNGETTQEWTALGNAQLEAHSGACATLSGGATASATKVVLESCTDAADQKWAIGPGGAWADAVATSQLCLSDPSNSTTNGTATEVLACTGATGQKWVPPATTDPAPPTLVTVTAGASSAILTWTPPVSGGGEAITGYVVRSSGGQTADTGPYATTATVTGLTAGTSYTFTVTAQTSLGTAATAATSAITPGNETMYTYDAAGNFTSTETDGLTTANSYNADEELNTSATGTATTSYGYDADGNQTSAGNNAYTYNGAGDLTGADTAAGNFTYAYDSSRNLTSASLDGTKIAGTIWDLNNPLPMAAEDTNAAGTTTADYTWNPDDTLASITTSAGTDDAVSDWLGSLTGLVNSSGTQLTTTTYGAYGSPSTTDLASAAPSPSIGYAASYSLPGTGLDDMRARDYNPATSLFSTVDPLLAQTSQPYAYTDESPVSMTDPTGTITCPSWLPGCGVITNIQNDLSSLGQQIWNNVYADNPCVNENAARIAAIWPIPTEDNCYECAVQIQRILGGGQILKITPSGSARALGPSTNNPSGTWQEHYAVEKDGRIYDGFTGPEGLPEAEFTQQFEYWDYFDIEP